MSLVGKLEDLGLGEILPIIGLSRKTGTLFLRSGGREGAIVFQHGLVVAASSSSQPRSLGEFLIHQGVIDLATFRKALALQQEGGFSQRLADVLVSGCGVSREAIEAVVREQVENIVFSLLEWGQGSFDFSIPGPGDGADDIRKDPLQCLLEQGLNAQFLALEGARVFSERLSAEEGALDVLDVSDDDIITDAADGGGAVAASGAGRSAAKQPLVVVDDDASTLREIAEGLRRAGYEVHDVTRSEDTLITVDGLFRTGLRPTILVDLIMPKMDGSGVLGGLELLEILHKNFSGFPVILMTDFHHAEAESRVRELGYAVVMKPRRSEMGDEAHRQAFFSQVISTIGRGEGEEAGRQERIDLADELRHEMGVDDDTQAPAPASASGGLSMLRGMLEELNNPDLQGGVMLLVLRFASEFLNRAIIFTLNGNVVSGAGQFGVSGDKGSGDRRVREIHFAVESASMFHEPYRTGHPAIFRPVPSSVDSYIFDKLGDGIPEEVFIAPIVGRTRVIGFLYGDNLPAGGAVGNTETLEIFLSQAGMAVERVMLERQLREKGRQ